MAKRNESQKRSKRRVSARTLRERRRFWLLVGVAVLLGGLAFLSFQGNNSLRNIGASRKP